MSRWKSVRARQVLAALQAIGWSIKRHGAGSHRVLERDGWPNYVFAFHDNEEIGPKMLARIARRTGLSPEDL
jgi:predicted RNA binding protein YcfA (HicA-like mRNA interferase family)